MYNNTNPDQPPPQDYDVPKSRADTTQQQQEQQMFGQGLYDTPKSKSDLYDSPKSTAAHIKTIEDLYDKPTQRKHMMGQWGMHLETHSNRSSGISMLSSVSGTSVSNHSFQSADSAPSSVRSSADASHDPYDIPQRLKSVSKTPLRKAKSSDNILDALDTYDSPQKGIRSLADRRNMPPDRSAGDYCEIKEEKRIHSQPIVGGEGSKPKLPYHRKTKEHALDDLDMYDFPRNTLTHKEELVQPAGRVKGYQIRGNVEKSGIYDVPPQVTRDSPVQESLSHTRLTGGSSDTQGPDLAGVSYDELALERDAAVELLVKLREDLQKAISKLLYFVNSTWRRRENLQPKMFDVKISCLAVRTALQEFMEFGQGTLANAVKLEDKRLAKKVQVYLLPVQQTFTKICQCMASLDSIKWDINKLSTEVVDSTIIDDELNQIVNETSNLTVIFIQLSSFIKANAPLLFEKNDGLEEPVHDVLVKQTPPRTRPKPPPVKPKPSFGSADSKDDSRGSKAHSIQERPLPTPPSTQKDLPPLPSSSHSTLQRKATGNVSITSTQDSTTTQPPAGVRGVDYDIPKTRQQQKDLLEVKKRQYTSPPLPEKGLKEASDYDNAKPQPVPMEDYDQIVDQEYDYVALTPDQMKNSLAFKYSQLPGSDYDSPRSHAVENYDSPSGTATKVYDSSSNSNSSGLYDSPRTTHSLQMYDSPQNNTQVRPGGNRTFNESIDLDMTGQLEGMEVPTVRTSGLSSKFHEKLVKLQKEAETNVVVQGDRVSRNVESVSTYRRQSQVNETDKQVLLFYANQIESHYSVLVNAMETLFQAMDYNQPPKVFITNSKFVILAAHKLVYIGDTITRNISNKEVSQGIVLGANLLCDALKDTVNATKKAALHFPSVRASQEMVDRVVDVSHAAGALKAAIVQPVTP